MQLLSAPHRGELQEDGVHVVADRLVRRHEAEVGVELRRAVVVVAGAQVHVAAQLAALPPYDHQHLGVALVAHDAVDHAGACVPEPHGSFDVGAFVEPSQQLHDDGHLLAVAGRLDQLLDDRRVAARSVQRLLDGEHVRVPGGRVQQLDHRVERLERVVHEHIPLTHDLEDRSGRVPPEGCSGGEGGPLQVRSVDLTDQVRQPVHVDGPVDGVEVVDLDPHLPQQLRHGVGRAVVCHLQPHALAVASPGQLALEGIEQIDHLLFVDPQIAVPGDAELVAGADRHAREQLAHLGVDDRRDEGEVAGPGYLGRELEGAGQHPRHLQDGDGSRTPEGVLAIEGHHEAQRLVDDRRERVSRIEGHRRQQGGDLILEVPGRPLALGLGPHRAAQHADPLLLQGRQKLLVEDLVLLGDQLVGPHRDPAHHLCGAQSVRPRLDRVRSDALLHATDPHLEELVHVRGRDRQETQPLQERHVGVSSLGQDTSVELDLGQLAVEVEGGVVEIDLGGGGCRVVPGRWHFEEVRVHRGGGYTPVIL